MYQVNTVPKFLSNIGKIICKFFTKWGGMTSVLILMFGVYMQFKAQINSGYNWTDIFLNCRGQNIQAYEK